jgi:hypothetical protein
MLNRSVFIFACVCRCEFQLEEKGSFRCPECGRLLVLEWRPEDGAGRAGVDLSGEKKECDYAESR